MKELWKNLKRIIYHFNKFNQGDEVMNLNLEKIKRAQENIKAEDRSFQNKGCVQ